MAALMNSHDSNSFQILERQPIMLPQQAAQIKNQSNMYASNASQGNMKQYQVHPAQFNASPITSLFQMADPSYKPMPMSHYSSSSLASDRTQSSLHTSEQN